MSARSSLTARIAVPALLVLTATVVHGRFPLEGLGQPRPASEAPTDRSGWTSSDTSGQPGTAVVTRAGGGEWCSRNMLMSVPCKIEASSWRLLVGPSRVVPDGGGADEQGGTL